ncbi:tyrosine-type recombinase/integrase [Dysosmobacter sp. NSJ-60]|uniref:Integrase n=1 Tax=Pusillibacter faecalis TaxID=2714358 RepID=A0A830QSU2_9FIRM|nr:tyrosine-type recombinase/integrase [Pusillibacter faecalis]MBC5748167.1 tyrosine-type recombinase/integrase [Dysosmobacter hominis]MCQ5027466.1 site-specific integrase [Oscillibacter valericigenes]BCK86075.1 integrase [Pusillibacter faecalis]
MEKQLITNELLLAFSEYLQSNERAPGTIEKYLRDVSAFRIWLGNRSVTKELTAEWKERLLENNHAPVTVNSMLAAVNSFFRFAGWEDCQVKFLKLQRRLFRDAGRELSRAEYERLVETAANLSRPRLALLMEAICGTGVRVSEVRYLTVEAVQAGRADISLKGKIRTILIPNKLCRKLLKYARKQKITSGEIFLTRSGKGMSRRQIWAEMKSLCERAGVEPSKVFPHNLRHVFAAAFYKSCKDIVRLADVLGHSSVETTRIYLLTTGVEHAQMLERLGLVL